MVPDIPNLSAPDSGEARAFLALQQLPDDYRIYHSVSYRLAGAGRPAREGEIDFLVLRPGDGILCLEVKGGQIAYDGRSYSWTSKGRSGETNRIADPFAQAQFHVKDLVAEIGRRKPWGDDPPDFAHGYGVIFPDCEYAPEHEPISAPRALVIDADDLIGRLEPRIREIFQVWARPGKEPLTKRQIKQLGQQVLAPHFELGLSLSTAIEWEERALALLDEEQSICLEFLELNARALVEGAAGTGKTLIALEIARRLASEGADVLLLCFNRPLAHQLRTTAASWTGLGGSVHAGSFHDLCRDWAVKAQLEWDPPEYGSGSTRPFWDKEANDRLREAAARLGTRFDALVVDEAQDIHADWWPTLDGLLRDPLYSRIVLFADPAQDLWSRAGSRAGKLPWHLPKFPLRVNQRNTGAISHLLGELGGVSFRRSSRVPGGEPVDVRSYTDSDDQRAKIEEVLEHLFRQGLTVDQIVVIGTRKIENSFLRDNRTLTGHTLTAVDDSGSVADPTALRYSTPGRFKGLEADVVLLCDVDGNENACSARNLYVAVSRARHRIYAFVKEGVMSILSPPAKGVA